MMQSAYKLLLIVFFSIASEPTWSNPTGPSIEGRISMVSMDGDTGSGPLGCNSNGYCHCTEYSEKPSCLSGYHPCCVNDNQQENEQGQGVAACCKNLKKGAV